MTTKRLALTMVGLERDAGVATITLQRPDQYNAMNPALVQQMRWAFDEAEADPAVSGIVIAGTGKTFSAGADLGFILRILDSGDLERLVKITYTWQAAYDAIAACRKPVVARVHAANMGAGVELALACHGIVATPRASFQLPEAGLGIYPCLGGTQRTPRAIGPGLAKWMMYTGSTLRAPDAMNIGLVADVVAEEDLDATCRRYALANLPEKRAPELDLHFATLDAFFSQHRADDLRTGRANTAGDPTLMRAMKLVAAKAPVALRFIEELIDQGLQRPLADGLQMEIDRVMDIYQTADSHLGLHHRAQNRIGPATFEGR